VYVRLLKEDRIRKVVYKRKIMCAHRSVMLGQVLGRVIWFAKFEICEAANVWFKCPNALR